MIGLDANVLVRYFAEDDPVQWLKVNKILENDLTPISPGFVSVVAMAETVWVLARVYDFDRNKLVKAIESILQAENLVVQEEQAVFKAMVALQWGKGSFADALIGQLGAIVGCRATLTFDRKAARLDGFELIR